MLTTQTPVLNIHVHLGPKITLAKLGISFLLPDDHQLGDRVRLQVSHGVARRELRAVIWVWTTVYPLEPKCGTEFPQDLGSTVQSYTRTAWLLYCHWEAPRTPGTQLYRQGRGPCAVGRESSPFGLHPYQEGR